MIIHVRRHLHTSWHTHQDVIHISATPCQAPIRVRAGQATVWIDCGRRLPAVHQCRACRHCIITETVIDHTDHINLSERDASDQEQVA